MEIIFCVFAILFIFSIWRRMHQQLQEQKFRYAMFSLRDKLRRLAIDQKINSENWIFRYADNTFSQSITEAYHLTLFHIVIRAVVVHEQQEKKYARFRQDFDKALSENPEMKAIFFDYRKSIYEYLTHQHYIGYTFFVKPAVKALMGGGIAQKKLKRYLNVTFYQPNDDNFPSSFVHNHAA